MLRIETAKMVLEEMCHPLSRNVLDDLTISDEIDPHRSTCDEIDHLKQLARGDRRAIQQKPCVIVNVEAQGLTKRTPGRTPRVATWVATVWSGHGWGGTPQNRVEIGGNRWMICL